jgi:hypothetical protein
MSVYGDASYLVAFNADRPALIDLIIALNYFLPRLGNIRREGEKEILTDALLDADPSRRILAVATLKWIDFQAGKSCQLLHAAPDLANCL